MDRKNGVIYVNFLFFCVFCCKKEKKKRDKCVWFVLPLFNRFCLFCLFFFLFDWIWIKSFPVSLPSSATPQRIISLLSYRCANKRNTPTHFRIGVDGTQKNKCWDVSKNVRHFPKSGVEETIEYFYCLMFAVCTVSQMAFPFRFQHTNKIAY